MRVKKSFGSNHCNEGSILCLSEAKYVVDHSRKFYLLDIVPMGAVRMSSSDKWKTNPNHPNPLKRQRDVVKRYFEYKNTLKKQASSVNYELGQYLDVVFFMPMPNSWSEKEKAKNNGLPCKVKPDTDNLVKAFKDALREQDGDVWYEKAEKRWAYNSSILIYQ